MQNEIVGFCDAQCGFTGKQMPGFDPNYPPFLPGTEKLFIRTLNMTAQQAMGIHYDVHSLFGYHEAQGFLFLHPLQCIFPFIYAIVEATNRGLVKARGKRPFIIGRSTFAGQSKYGSHWYVCMQVCMCSVSHTSSV